MFTLHKPTQTEIARWLDTQRSLPFTYNAVGATATIPPVGYRVNHTRVSLGQGEDVFRAASAGLRSWSQFDLGWLTASPTDTPIEVGQVVAVVARKVSCWWFNSCRIIYVVNEESPHDRVWRFGFAYGTLPEHMGTGEERFLIEWDQAEGTVWYDILAFSRPHKLLSKVGYPLFRMSQRQFGRDSTAAMRRVVGATSAAHPAAAKPAAA